MTEIEDTESDEIASHSGGWSEEQYKTLRESTTTYFGPSGGTLAIRIQAGGTLVPEDANQDTDLRLFAGRAIDIIADSIHVLRNARDPDKIKEAKDQREYLLSAFGDRAIYVEEIRNGYSNRAEQSHLPWFTVTTSIGRIKIGWRKRVVSIDWEDSLCKKDGSELFPDENVTKGGPYIHAWSKEKMIEYVNKIIEAGEETQND